MGGTGIRSQLAITTAAAVAMVVGYGRRAYAACVVTASPNYLCSGNITTGQTVNVNNATVTTSPGFSVTTSSGEALEITGSGALSFIDSNGSSLSTSDTTNITGTGLRIFSSGDIPGTAGSVTVYAGRNTTIVGNALRVGGGIYAINRGSGTFSLTLNGSATGTNYDGIIARNFGTTMAITLGATSVVQGRSDAMYATNFGSGAMTITANGELTGQLVNGMTLRNYGADLTVQAGAGSRITGYGGIYARNSGSGALTITTNGSTVGTGKWGIVARNNGTDFSLTTGAASQTTGATYGILAYQQGTGSLSITTNGPVVGNGADGIWARNYTGTSMTMTTADVTGGTNGIRAINSGSGALSITTSGATVGKTKSGIYAENDGTNFSLTTGATSQTTGATYGIIAEQRGTGSLSITTNGPVVGNGADGIWARNYSGTSMTIAMADVTGEKNGIHAINSGSGALSITTSGATIGTTRSGIYAENHGTNLSLTTGATSRTTGATYGILAEQLGSGSLSITTNGPVAGNGADGIWARNYALSTSMTINTADVTGATNGIIAINNGSGALSITTRGNVIGTSGHGIAATNDASSGPIAITVNTSSRVQGAFDGIYANAAVGSPIKIANAGIVQNSSQLSNALAIQTIGPSTTITNTGLVLGTVNLGNQGNNVFDNRFGGVWNTAGGTNSFDPGGNSVNNEAGATIVAAANPAVAQTTTFNGLQSFFNAGRIVMQDGFAGDRTVVTGNFIGQRGTITLDTFLGKDGSASDRLVLNGGTASGTTALDIRNSTGPGARTVADGIMVVNSINGATTTPTAFRLSHALEAGAFEYLLYYGGVGADANDQNWYLRNTGPNGTAPPSLTPSAQTTLPYTDILKNFALATLGTLQQRSGNRIWFGEAGPSETIWCKEPAQNDRCAVADNRGPEIYGAGAWARVGSQYSQNTPIVGSPYTQGLGFLQAGYEGVAYSAGSGDLTVGGYTTLGNSHADVNLTPDPITGAIRRGAVDSTGYGLGANATWLGSRGLYFDAVEQFTWYESRLSNSPGASNGGWSAVSSLEAGKRFDLGQGLAVVPQVQVAWTRVNFGSFTDIYGALNSAGDSDSLRGRAGLRVEKTENWRDADNQTRRMQLYGIANISYEFLNATSVVLNGIEIQQQDARLWSEVGLGGTYAWNDRWSLFGEASYATALHRVSDETNYTVKGTVGVRYTW